MSVPPNLGRFVGVVLRSDTPEDSKKCLAKLVGESHGVAAGFTDNPGVAGAAFVVEVDSLEHTLARRHALHLRVLDPRSMHDSKPAAVVRHDAGLVFILVECTKKQTAAQNVATTFDGALFAGAPPEKIVPKKDELARIYLSIGRTADDLPYTPEFESLFEQYGEVMEGRKIDHAEVWRQLLTMRKAKLLPRLGPAITRPPEVKPEEKQHLRALLGADIGRRDRLPYSKRFSEISDGFNATRRRPMSPHLLWRLIATLAK